MPGDALVAPRGEVGEVGSGRQPVTDVPAGGHGLGDPLGRGGVGRHPGVADEHPARAGRLTDVPAHHRLGGCGDRGDLTGPLQQSRVEDGGEATQRLQVGSLAVVGAAAGEAPVRRRRRAGGARPRTGRTAGPRSRACRGGTTRWGAAPPSRRRGPTRRRAARAAWWRRPVGPRTSVARPRRPPRGRAGRGRRRAAPRARDRPLGRTRPGPRPWRRRGPLLPTPRRAAGARSRARPAARTSSARGPRPA